MTNDPDETCALCQKPTEPRDITRRHQLCVCEDCAVGDIAARLKKERNWIVQTDQHVTETGGSRTGQARRLTQTKIIIKLDGGSLKLRFRRRNLLTMIAGIVKRRITVEDPLFNQVVHATSKDRPTAQQFLDHEGVQSAIMDTLGAGLRSVIDIDGSDITIWHYMAGFTSSEQELVVSACVLAEYLATNQ